MYSDNFSIKEFEGVNEAIGKGMKWEDLKVGFNLVVPKGEGKMIIEKKPDGTIDIKTNLVI